MKREFLITNNNGTYANMGLEGELRRMFAGYLVASFTPPQDRTVVLEWIHEMVADGSDVLDADVYSAAWLPGIGPAEYDETDFVPCMRYSSDILNYTRSVVLDREGNDCVKVVYDYENPTDHDITVFLRPWMTFRRPDTPAKWGDIKFSPDGTACITEKDFKAGFTPKSAIAEDIPCEVTLMAQVMNASLKVNSPKDTEQHYVEDPHYIEDELTGEPQIRLFGVCYAPYEFEIGIPAGQKATAAVLCEVHRTDIFTEKELRAKEAETEAFMRLPVNEFKSAHHREWQENLDRAHMREILDRFSSKLKLWRLYEDLVISAPKFITAKAGTPFSTIMAGYPWFLDWGRDTMIAFTGLLLVTGRFETAKDVLRAFVHYEKHGMLPNVFPGSSGGEPQYNTVDASLWFFYAADMYVKFSGDEAFVTDELLPAMRSIISLYTRTEQDMKSASADAFCYGIYMDSEGFVHAGTDEADQLTWMDVRIDGKAVTPRHDCPVEIQALMYNALCVMQKYDPDNAKITAYREPADRLKSNCMLFYNQDSRCLYDYIEGKPGRRSFDKQIRPNQIWAVSLPYTMFDEAVNKQIVDTVRDNLVTNLGIRSLSPDDPAYIGKYEGNLRSRDAAYHNGTSWGFLTGHYILAYLKVYGDDPTTLGYLCSILESYYRHAEEDGCIYGIAEVFDGDSPQTGKGCYNQAWSVGCLLEAIYKMCE